MHSTHCRFTYLVASALLLTAPIPAFAISKLSSPNVVKGEFEMEYVGSRTFDRDSAKDNEQGHEFEIEYGFTDNLAMELEVEFEREPGEKLKSEALGISGIWQFYEPGEQWLDSGLKFGYEHATHHGDADAVFGTLLLQKDWGKTEHLANLKLKQEIGSSAEGGPARDFLWSSRYRYSRAFEPGFEWQSKFGKTSDDKSYDEQEHYVGPAVYGQILPRVKYEAAYLFGASDAAAEGAARVLLEYEMYF